MATNIGMPEFILAFKGLGVSAIKRGERGAAALILIDNTVGDTYKKYINIGDLTSEEQAKYTEDNVLAIKDALEGTPLELHVFKVASDVEITDIFKFLAGKVPRNCWIGLQSGDTTQQNDLISFVKSEIANNKKRYKVFTYKATNSDSMHITNQTNTMVEFPDERGMQTGDKAIAYMIGYYAGLPLSMSGIAKPLKFKSVSEPEDLNVAISNGEHVLFNDEGVVKVARAVNSLVSLGENIIVDMCHINTVEKMDFIYSDIISTWDKSYKGKYSNLLGNQMLFISALNGYFQSLTLDNILDPEFDNRGLIAIEKQRIANYPKYGEEVVKSWDDNKAMAMTVGTKVFLRTNLKISGIMEDFDMDVFM